MFEITDKLALVTGATGGIGGAIARAFHAQGATVAISGRQADKLEALKAELGERVVVTPCDLASKEQVGKLIDEAVKALGGRLDILVNNAGISIPGKFTDHGDEDVDKVLEVMLHGPYALMRAAWPVMEAQRYGRIVNITSSAVKAPIDVLGLSNGARSGLTGFVAGIARKTVVHNVTINNLLPGVFDTDRIRATVEGQAKAAGIPVEEMIRRRVATVPAGRLGDPYEFGQACAYLCSAQAAYVTGQNFLIDGGAYPGTY